MESKTKIITFFALAEGIAALWAIIPFMVLLAQQQSDPTNLQYIFDMADIIPGFLIGQIPGMIISGIVHAIFGIKRSSNKY